jgi:transposase
MQLAEILHQHLPKDPQAEYAPGDVLRLLVAARLSHPVALVNVGRWAHETGADLLAGIPADKLNDDRLGRALDAFYPQRHSILAQLALQVAQTFGVPLERLHYDPTHLLLHGAYENSQPRSQASCADPPAHITYGHQVDNSKVVQAGLCVAVDELGPVPLFGHVTDGNHNGHTAIAEQFELLLEHLRPQQLLLLSDRGTFSVGHVARVHEQGLQVLCSAPWADYQALYDEHREQLHWQRASYLSQEQQRRRQCASRLPQEHYNLAVLKHTLREPQTKQDIPSRLIFVYSSADAKVMAKTRHQAVERIRTGLAKVAQAVAAGRRHSDPVSVQRRIDKLFGRQAAAAYFRWQLVPLTAAEQAALPPPGRGCQRTAYRLEYHYDESAAEQAASYDGLSVLVTTAARTQSADVLFRQYKEQNYVEQSHHQWKSPLAVHPVFLKTPQRIEALVYVLLIALMAYHLLQRKYRQQVPSTADAKEKRTTTETLLRRFAHYSVVVERWPQGQVVRPTQLSSKQRHILERVGFPTPAQVLSRLLPRHPP